MNFDYNYFETEMLFTDREILREVHFVKPEVFQKMCLSNMADYSVVIDSHWNHKPIYKLVMFGQIVCYLMDREVFLK